MTIDNLSELTAALPQSQKLYYLKTGGITSVAGILVSLWTQTAIPAAGSTPPTGAGEVPTSATTGAIPFVAPTGGAISYISGGSITTGTNQTLILCDRLVHTSGLSGTSTSAQTVNSAAVDRPDSTGEGAMIFLEIYTATGGSATTVTASYTNQAGTSGRTTASVAFPASMAARYALCLPLEGTDTGVRSVQSVTLAASTGTAGNFGVTIARPILVTPLLAGYTGFSGDFLATGLVDIPDNACLFTYVLPPGVTAGGVTGLYYLSQG